MCGLKLQISLYVVVRFVKKGFKQIFCQIVLMKIQFELWDRVLILLSAMIHIFDELIRLC